MKTKIQSILMMTFLGGMFLFCIANLNHTNKTTPLTSIETISYEDIHGTKPSINKVEVEVNFNTTVGVPLEETTEKVTIPEAKEEMTPVYSNRWDISLTDNEIDLLARILWVEARGECKEGQIAVVEVVFNRMLSRSQDLTTVLSARNQFASWGIRNTAKNYGTQIEIVKEVLQGKTNVLDKNVIYFAMYPLGKNVVKVIGNHYFSTDWCTEVALRQGK